LVVVTGDVVVVDVDPLELFVVDPLVVDGVVVVVGVVVDVVPLDPEVPTLDEVANVAL